MPPTPYQIKEWRDEVAATAGRVEMPQGDMIEMIGRDECVFCGGPHPIFEDDPINKDEVDGCAICGRMVCMDCALFAFSETGVGYLCPDCGEPTDQVMRRINAPMLFPEPV